MPARRRSPGPPLCVKIVCANEETLDGLEAYLRQAGILVHGTRELDARAKSPPPNAIVFFPDEFPTQDVLKVMVRVHRQRPELRLVVVTHHRQRFADAFETDEEEMPPTIIPKPAWGWTILEAIRGGAPE